MLPNLREILSLEDPSPVAVNYMGITTGFSSQGQWIFYGIPGRPIPIFNPYTEHSKLIEFS